MPELQHPSFQERARAEELVQSWLEQSLDHAQADELLGLLQRYPDLDEWTIGHLHSHQVLRELLAGAPISANEDLSPGWARRRHPGARKWALLGGSLTLAMMMMVCIWAVLQLSADRHAVVAQPRPESPIELQQEEESIPLATSPQTAAQEPSSPQIAPGDEQMTDAVAIVSKRLRSAASPNSPQLETGDVLSPGRRILEDGLICVDFFQGARVALQAPCDFEILSNNRIRVLSGRVFVALPNSLREFQVETAQGEINESGQLMGVIVDPQATQVHVFEGQARLGGFGKLRVGQGKSQSFTRQQVQKSAAADPAQFVSVQQLDQRYLAARAARRQSWVAQGRKWNLDPSLVLRFEFSDLDGQPPHQLRNLAGLSSVAAGSVVGCRTSSTDWTGARTLTFENLTDRVCIDIPDVFEAVTLTAWVRVHALPEHFSGLLMSDGSPLGGLHWQLTKLGRIRLCYLNDSIKWNKLCELDSPVIPKEELLNKWVHLAVTVDAARQRAAHYINGRMVIDGPLLIEHDICISQASLGNWWRPSNQQSPIRNLNGDLGEMTLHARALSDDEILTIYHTGSSHDLAEATGMEAAEAAKFPQKMSVPSKLPSDPGPSHQ